MLAQRTSLRQPVIILTASAEFQAKWFRLSMGLIVAQETEEADTGSCAALWCQPRCGQVAEDGHDLGCLVGADAAGTFSKLTSRTQCRRFSMPQWPPLTTARRLASAVAGVRLVVPNTDFTVQCRHQCACQCDSA